MIDDETARLAQKLVAAANQAAGLLDAFKIQAVKNAAVARSQAAKVRESSNAATQKSGKDSIDKARADIDVQIQGLAPGVLSCRWDELDTLRQDPQVLGVAEYVRAGSLVLRQPGHPQAEVPLLVPFLNRANIVIQTRTDRRDAAAGTVQEVILRSLLGTGPGQLSVVAFDPTLSGTLAMFTPLRQANEEVIRPALAAPEELRELFDRLSRDVRRISDMYGGVPTDLGEFRRATGQPIEHYQVVTILDYPTGFDERLNTMLLTLLRTGPSCGISFIVHHAVDAAIPDGVDPSALSQLATQLDLDVLVFAGAEGYQMRIGTTPNAAIVEPALVQLASRIRQAAAPKIDFLDLQPAPDGYWAQRTADRVSAIIGRIGHQPIEITLGDEIEQKHNVLVTGAVGQGKSNLLMTLIHSWALRYSPDELELYLLDFKDGVSLYPLAAHGQNRDWLPHARVLGLESDRPYGLAVLEHLVNEFERRSKVIKPFGDNIARYRQEQPTAVMPRIIAVIDEFQVLFEEDDETTSAALLALERLARRGRGYGIHLVLASQTLSGITALLAKQDGIFSQFPIRLALYNSASESRAVLSQNNTEAARLRYRGELIVNKDFGEVDANQRGVVAFADPERLRAVRAELVTRDESKHIPSTFNGALAINPAERLKMLTPSGDTPTALLGVAISVDSESFATEFDASSGRHLAVLGTGKRVDGTPGSAPADALQVAALSLAASSRPGTARFTILNALASNDPTQATVNDLVISLQDRQFPVKLVGATDIVNELGAIEQEVAERRAASVSEALYIVGFGLDRLPQARVINFETGTTPIDGLLAVWREGAPLGVHLLGWWSNVRVFNDHVGLDAQGLIDITMVFKIPADAVLDVFGPFVSWVSPDNRALVRDSAQNSTPTVVVPFSAADTSDIRDAHLRREARS